MGGEGEAGACYREMSWQDGRPEPPQKGQAVNQPDSKTRAIMETGRVACKVAGSARAWQAVSLPDLTLCLRESGPRMISCTKHCYALGTEVLLPGCFSTCWNDDRSTLGSVGTTEGS